jgi:hypothetical protein
MHSGCLAALALALLSACGGEDTVESEDPPPAPRTFTVGGSTTGLAGTGLVLRNNAGDDLAIAANGNFTFGQALAAGAAYAVSIRSQPNGPDQVCSLTGGSGNIAAANVTTVAVTCATPTAASFTIGGTVTGLNGTLVLRSNAGADLSLSADGAFTFGGTVANGAGYEVSVASQPASPPQVCSVRDGAGVVSGANVTSVKVDCSEFLTVISSTPADSATGVARDGNITLRFSANLDPATVNLQNITMTSSAGSRPITVFAADNEITVRPDAKLLPLARYTVIVTPEVRGAAGQRLAGNVTLSFTGRDGQWSSPQVLSAELASGAQLALDPQGNAMAVWTQGETGGYRVWSRRYVSGWGTPTPVSHTASQLVGAQVGVDAQGNAIAVWTEYESQQLIVLGARYSVGSGWGSETLLSGAPVASNPQIAVDPAGNAMVVWDEVSDSTATVWARRYVAGAGWDGGQQLNSTSFPPLSGAMVPMVALDVNGNALITYRKAIGIFWDLWAHRFTVSGGWEAPSPIEDETASAGAGPLAFDRFGNAIAVWTQGSANFGHASIWANRYVAGTGWGAATLLENDTLAPGNSSGPPAIDGEGNALVVWQHSDLSRTATDIWANRYVVGTGWGTQTLIETQRKGDANYPTVAADSSGNAIALWKEHDGTRYRLWTNRYVRGSGWGIAVRLDPEDGEIWSSQIAVDAQGNAIAIWSRSDPVSGGSRIYTARFE